MLAGNGWGGESKFEGLRWEASGESVWEGLQSSQDNLWKEETSSHLAYIADGDRREGEHTAGARQSLRLGPLRSVFEHWVRPPSPSNSVFLYPYLPRCQDLITLPRLSSNS